MRWEVKIFALACVLGAMLLVRPASAFPFMIRHSYTGCAPCHIDPSGEGLLTEYGRAQSVLLLSTRYGKSGDEEPGRFKDFLFGVPTPSWLTLGGWVRNAYLWTTERGDLVDNRFLAMRADLAAQVSFDVVRAYGSLGYATQPATAFAERAWVSQAATWGNVVSREFWLGVSLDENAILLRAGRINLPFGLRLVEHTAWVRSATRTDINQAQQDGAAFSYSRAPYRLEIMGILGNYQVNPDRFRERGYAGYVERSFGKTLAVGLSSTVTRAGQDITLGASATREAHGAFARYAIVPPLVAFVEADLLVVAPDNASTFAGGVGWLQFDYEPLQGLHFDLSGEFLSPAKLDTGGSLGTWVGVDWFFLPHFEARFDTIVRGAGGAATTVSYLGQINIYL